MNISALERPGGGGGGGEKFRHVLHWFYAHNACHGKHIGSVGVGYGDFGASYGYFGLQLGHVGHQIGHLALVVSLGPRMGSLCRCFATQ